MQVALLNQLLHKIQNETFVVSGKATEELEQLDLAEPIESDLIVFLVNKCLAPSTSYSSRIAHRKLLQLALHKGLNPTGRASNGLFVSDAILQYDLATISPTLKFDRPTLPLTISLKGKLGTLIKLAARMRQGERAETLLELRNSPFDLAQPLAMLNKPTAQHSGVSLSNVLRVIHSTTDFSVRPSDVKQGYKLQLHPSLPKTFRHAVHDAVISYHPAALRDLMQAGVSSSIRDFFGRTPHHLAEIVDAPQCREILLDYPTSRLDNFGRSVEQTRSWLEQRDQEPIRSRLGKSGGWSQDVDPSLHTEKCEIDVVDGSSFSFKRFLSDYVSCLKPVLIKGGISRWAELQERWKKDQFVHRFGAYSVISGKIPYAGTFGLGSHKKALQRSASGLDDYVFSPVNRNQHAALFEDLKLIGAWTRLACTHWQLYQGVAGTGAPMHLHTDAWNALVYGRKRWMVLPPSRAVYSLLGPLEFLQQERDHLRPLEWVQEAGDICYIPRYWSHSVLNLKECVGVATEFSSPYIG